jgi:protease-4
VDRRGPYGAAEALAKGLVDGIADGEDLEQKLAEPNQERARFASLARYKGRALPLQEAHAAAEGGPGPRGRAHQAGRERQGALRAAGGRSDTVAQALTSWRARTTHQGDRPVHRQPGRLLAGERAGAAGRAQGGGEEARGVLHRPRRGERRVHGGGGRPDDHRVACAITGSIGVFGGKFEISGLLDKLGVGRAVLALGANAAMESGFQPWSEGERAALDREIEQTYRDFLAAVAEGRKRRVEEVEPLAGGRVYTASRAKEAGLVDELGGFEDAVAKAAGMAGLKKKPDVVLIDVPAKTLSALTGVKGFAEAARWLLPLAEERLFALDETWVRLRPEP